MGNDGREQFFGAGPGRDTTAARGVPRSWKCGTVVLALALQALTVDAQELPPAPVPGASILDATNPLLTEPRTPAEQFDVTLLLVDLGRLDLARQYLERFEASNPDDELLLQLRARHGTAAFLRLAQVNELRPVSTAVLDRLNAAARRQAQDPAFVGHLIDNLRGTASERDLAQRELRNLGEAAVPELMRRLNVETDPSEIDRLVIATVQLGRGVAAPVIAGLDAPSERTRVTAADILGYLRAPEAVRHLWAPAFAPSSSPAVRQAAQTALGRILKTNTAENRPVNDSAAVADLKSAARAYLAQEIPLPVNENGETYLWTWAADVETVGRRVVTPAVGSTYLAARFARDAALLSPRSDDLRQLELLAALAYESSLRPVDATPAYPQESAAYAALLAGTDSLLNSLQLALQTGQSGAAVTIIDILSQVGSRSLIRGSLNNAHPLRVALNYPDARVQFAAASAIMQLDPQEPFIGSHRVVEIFQRGLTGRAEPVAVVADADNDRATATSGYLRDLGYDVRHVQTGKDAFRVASSTSGVALVIVEANVTRWELSQTVANFRADARTAYLPLFVYGEEKLRLPMEAKFLGDRMTAFLPYASSTDHFGEQSRPFLARLRRPPLTNAEVTRHRLAALYWLGHIVDGQRANVFDVTPAEGELARLLDDTEAGSQVVAILGSIPTATAQERLHQTAVNATFGPALRRQAALQLAFHIQRYGFLISPTGREELRLAWTQAEDADLRVALASVLGSARGKPELSGTIGPVLPNPVLP